MSESYVRVPVDDTGKMLRTVQRTIGANTVHDEVIEIADPSTGNAIDPRLVTVQAGTNTIGWINVSNPATLAPSSNTIGAITIASGQTLSVNPNQHPVVLAGPVTINNNATVSITGTPVVNIGNNSTIAVLPALAAGSNTIGAVNLASGQTLSVNTSQHPVVLASPVTINNNATVSITGTPSVLINNNSTIAVLPSIPAGTNTIGAIGVTSLPALAAGSNTIGAINIASGQTLAVNPSQHPVVLASPVTINNNATVSITGSPVVILNNNATIASVTGALPSGSNTIGAITLASGQTLSVNPSQHPVVLASPVTINNNATVSITGNPVVLVNNNATIASLPSLPAGSNTIGAISVTSLPALAAGSNTIGAMNIASGQTLAVNPSQHPVVLAGPVTINNNATVSITGTAVVAVNNNATIAVLPALVAGSSTIGAINIASGQTLAVNPSQHPVIVNNNATIASLPALPAGSNTIGAISVTTLPALPASSNTIGAVIHASPVTINNNATVSITGSPVVIVNNNATIAGLPAIPAGTNTIGAISVTSLPALAAGSNTVGWINVLNPATLGAGSNTIGAINIASGQTLSVNTSQHPVVLAGPVTVNNNATVTWAAGSYVNVNNNATIAALPAIPAGANTIGALAPGANTIGWINVLNPATIGAGSNTIGWVNVLNPATLGAGSNTIGALSAGANTVGVVQLTTANMAYIRWGDVNNPTWYWGVEVTAPAAGSSLAFQTVPTGQTIYLYGVHISSPEANEFQVKVPIASGGTIRYAIPSAGVIIAESSEQKLVVAGPCTMSLQPVNAGSANRVYQAGMLMYKG